MGAHKLDIEFEDEEDLKAREEAKKKEEEAKKAAAEMEDLEFDVDDGTGEHSTPAEATSPTAAAAPVQKAAPAPAQAAPARAQAAAPAPAPAVQTGAYMHASPGAANYNLGDELRHAIGGNRILEIELQAKVEIAVTHRMTNYIAEQAQEKKVLETKVNKVLSGIAAKVPALKKELAQIKKLLAEHSTVDKSKLEEEGDKPSSEQPVQKKLTPEQMAARKKALAAKKNAA